MQQGQPIPPAVALQPVAPASGRFNQWTGSETKHPICRGVIHQLVEWCLLVAIAAATLYWDMLILACHLTHALGKVHTLYLQSTILPLLYPAFAHAGGRTAGPWATCMQAFDRLMHSCPCPGCCSFHPRSKAHRGGASQPVEQCKMQKCYWSKHPNVVLHRLRSLRCVHGPLLAAPAWVAPAFR
jgi:hypothetical protein